MISRGLACTLRPTSETAKPDAATWLAHTSGGVNCETGWVAAAAWPFLCEARARSGARVSRYGVDDGRPDCAWACPPVSRGDRHSRPTCAGEPTRCQYGH